MKDHKVVIKNKVVSIDISKIDFDTWDARDHFSDETKESVNSIKKSFTHLGQISPVTLRKKQNGRYSIITGRLRTKAAKELGWKTIQAVFLDTNDPITIRNATVDENLSRGKFTLDEEINAVLGKFEIQGFSAEDTKKLSLKMNTLQTKGINPETEIPVAFIETVKGLKYGPAMLYQVVRTVTEIPETIRKEMQKNKLTMDKRIALTNSTLLKHPQILLRLIKRVKDMTQINMKLLIAQEINDLETGATFQDDYGTYIFDSSRRVKIERKAKIVKQPSAIFLETMTKSQELLELITGHKLEETEFCYDPKHIDYSERHRIDILNDITKRQILNLENTLEVLKDGISSYLDLIDKKVIRN